MRLSRKWYAAEAIPLAATAASQQIITRQGILFGYSFVETTGAAVASLALVDGSSNNGKTTVPINLLAAQSTRDFWGYPGVWCDNGVWLQMNSGTVSGVIYFLPLTETEVEFLLDGDVAS